MIIQEHMQQQVDQDTVKDAIAQYKALASDWKKALVEAYAKGLIDSERLSSQEAPA